MADYDEEKELKMVETEAQKYINNNSEKNPPAKLKERLVRHLQRKGFSDTLIIKIINYNFPELTD
jgi:SOS response regulatory protein OraA/RecX